MAAAEAQTSSSAAGRQRRRGADAGARRTAASESAGMWRIRGDETLGDGALLTSRGLHHSTWFRGVGFGMAGGWRAGAEMRGRVWWLRPRSTVVVGWRWSGWRLVGWARGDVRRFAIKKIKGGRGEWGGVGFRKFERNWRKAVAGIVARVA